MKKTQKIVPAAPMTPATGAQAPEPATHNYAALDEHAARVETERQAAAARAARLREPGNFEVP